LLKPVPSGFITNRYQEWSVPVPTRRPVGLCYPAAQLRRDGRHRQGETVEAPAFDALPRQVRALLVTLSLRAWPWRALPSSLLEDF
jgi:hypothetical protein